MRLLRLQSKLGAYCYAVRLQQYTVWYAGIVSIVLSFNGFGVLPPSTLAGPLHPIIGATAAEVEVNTGEVITAASPSWKPIPL